VPGGSIVLGSGGYRVSSVAEPRALRALYPRGDRK
jgi:hypothetical protein